MDARNSDPKEKKKKELWMIIRKRKRKNVMYQYRLIHDSQEVFHKFPLLMRKLICFGSYKQYK
jgi:hypothetical protein